MARSDIILEQNNIRVVDEFQVADGTNSKPGMKVEPSKASVTVGGGHLSSGGGSVNVYNHKGDRAAALESGSGGGAAAVTSSNDSSSVVMTAAGNSGAFALDGPQGQGGIWVDAVNDNGRVNVMADNRARTIELESYHGQEGGGRIEVRDRDERPQVTASADSNHGGRLTVRTRDGTPTCKLDGQDASLVLNGPGEPGPEGEAGSRLWGGGELVINEGIDQKDTHVHATAERDSDYGLDSGHRPRFVLNGPEGMLEIGREQQGPEAEAISGEVHLRDRQGNDLLRALAGGIRARYDQRAELQFWIGDQGDQIHRGAIRSHPDGLMFYDSNDTEALLIANNGDILTRKNIQQGAL